jgi:hypothetical protein
MAPVGNLIGMPSDLAIYEIQLSKLGMEKRYDCG